MTRKITISLFTGASIGLLTFYYVPRDIYYTEMFYGIIAGVIGLAIAVVCWVFIPEEIKD